MTPNPPILARQQRNARLDICQIPEAGHFAYWVADFRARALLPCPGTLVQDAPLTPAEKQYIGRSVAIFQRGESSEGKILRRQARQRVAETGFADYPLALDYLIREENQHASWLEHFLDFHQLPRLDAHPTDTLFRSLRHLGGLELSLTLLRIAEIIAVPYYRALRKATQSARLKAICSQILRDEARHLRFQQHALGCFLGARPRWARLAWRLLHGPALAAAVILVFFTHREVWRAASVSLPVLLRRCIRIEKELSPNFQ